MNGSFEALYELANFTSCNQMIIIDSIVKMSLFFVLKYEHIGKNI
jgi:hypothetical protein